MIMSCIVFHMDGISLQITFITSQYLNLCPYMIIGNLMKDTSPKNARIWDAFHTKLPMSKAYPRHVGLLHTSLNYT